MRCGGRGTLLDRPDEAADGALADRRYRATFRLGPYPGGERRWRLWPPRGVARPDSAVARCGSVRIAPGHSLFPIPGWWR